MMVFRKLNTAFSNAVKRTAGFGKGFSLLILVPLPMILIEIAIKPVAYGYTGHSYEWFWYYCFFINGYYIVKNLGLYYQLINQLKTIIAVITLILTILFILIVDYLQDQADLYLNGGWLLKGKSTTNFEVLYQSFIPIMHGLGHHFFFH